MGRQEDEQHQAAIIHQFSQQAIPFTQIPGHLDALQMLIELCGVGRDDHVLDVACGPGLVACAFARHARHVSGLDITPAMIAQARKRQQEQGLENLDWTVGDAVPLPYPDNSFERVLTRYSFHHLLDPELALAEMIRVCRPGGMVLVADVAMDAAKGAAYDRLEKMRDLSHTHALTLEEFDALYQHSGLRECLRSGYGVNLELEAQLRASFPRPGDGLKIREMIAGDVGVDRLGIQARRENGTVVYTVPISVYVGRKI
jgi:ubiquinone/menaquinone biosynthesis C-methylase UbiE